MTKDTKDKVIVYAVILLISIGGALYLKSHSNRSVCDAQPNSAACVQETKANDDAYQQSLNSQTNH